MVRDGDPGVSGFAFGSGNLVLGDTRGVGTIDGAHGARDHDKPIIARRRWIIGIYRSHDQSTPACVSDRKYARCLP